MVSWAYRAITGDQIAPGPMAIGGGLFGGLAGFSLGTAEAMIKGSSGKDGGGHLFAFLREAASPGDAPGGPVVADAPPQHGGPEIPPDQTPVLTPEQMAVLLASLPAPATNQNLAAPIGQPATTSPGAVAGLGGLPATGNLNPMFLPLVPMAGALPETDSNKKKDEAVDNAPATDAETFTGAVTVGDEIRALFGLN